MKHPARLLFAAAAVALALASPQGSAPMPQLSSRSGQTTSASEPVDINTASLGQLMKVPGLTRTWAARIIRYRPYRGKNELLDRGIVSGGVYARIKDHIIAHRIRD